MARRFRDRDHTAANETGYVDDNGRWHGTCPDCGTDHGGLQPGSLGALMKCRRAQGQGLTANDAQPWADLLAGDDA